jgi:CRISPR-associated endonuclease Cas1
MNLPPSVERIIPKHGIITLFGYGASICVDRGHLVLEDGIGPNRRRGRFARVGHGIKRVVVIGSEGLVSFAALRWLSAQDSAFLLLERNGKVLSAIGPVHRSDARLRRAQSLAHHSGAAVQISRELISQKLQGQERNAREALGNSAIASKIDFFRSSLANAKTVEAIRQLEAQGAQAYWSAWRDLPVNFPTADYRRVPEHWRNFGTRKSVLTGSPRLAVNPPNAMLNYTYALLEAESRLAAASIGLDPGIGVLHVDTDARDSLACDLMEPARPYVDAYLLKWITEGPLRREWFFEERNGNCRLMGSFATRLSECLSTLSRVVAPIAETVSRMIWSTAKKPTRMIFPPTHLTQSHCRQAKGKLDPLIASPPQPPRLCRTCGANITARHNYCSTCAVVVTTAELMIGAQKGRHMSHSLEAQASRAEKALRNMVARTAWKPSNQPDWLDERCYRDKIQPRLAGLTVRTIASTLGISIPYASNVRSGKKQLHPCRWQQVAQLVGIGQSDKTEGAV